MTQGNQNTATIDTHIHLDDNAFDHDREVVIEAAHKSGVLAFVNIGYSPERWESSALLRAEHPETAITLGLHPYLAELFDENLSRTLQDAIDRLRPVALGEMGLDFTAGNPAAEIQERAFAVQLELASALNLPVIIHQRAAADELSNAIDRSSMDAAIVLHSFDGTPRLTDWALERGAYVGIGGLATRRSSSQLRELLARIPTDRLLLETDAPYLVPAGIKDRRNVPANLPFIAAQLAPLWGIGPDQLCRITTINAKALFGISSIVD
jgi:TatD DNase family protein